MCNPPRNDKYEVPEDEESDLQDIDRVLQAHTERNREIARESLRTEIHRWLNEALVLSQRFQQEIEQLEQLQQQQQ